MSDQHTVFEEIKKKLGYRYCRKIIEEDVTISSKDVYSAFRGELRDLLKISKILTAAEIAIKKQVALESDVQRLSTLIIQ